MLASIDLPLNERGLRDLCDLRTIRNEEECAKAKAVLARLAAADRPDSPLNCAQSDYYEALATLVWMWEQSDGASVRWPRQ
ncbi:hypothetical protein SAMN05444156_2609 [Verrucomicrobium sp. GAS474]|uniref:hypothetical protein n=1 Tax=Verrucomicrobium sp. GAS474 TaxID=1882831 RepID=UPI00087A2BD9|nr:hypothetical protein [Verrucomicrobium sp. GAS474]SDU20783.1 hypothetical protein SAMN05444156_2609 [Verrucomicrobium sp. GAS474]